jgi:biotin synthase
MKLQQDIKIILNKALEGQPPSKSECVALLQLATDSLEAAALKATADIVSRRRFGNHGILLGQIGLETTPCIGNCKFCAFGKDHTSFKTSRLSLEEILTKARAFTQSGDLYALFLMTMHELNLEWLLTVVERIRKEIPNHTQIVVNVGDFDVGQAREMRASGVSGAYHVCRLREGIDTSLAPAARRKTFEAIRSAGLDLYYCCEPIGPEHTPDELVEQMFLGIEFGCFQHAAMRRVYVPGVPLAERGQITESRLAQVVAVVALATLGLKETKQIAVHEPNLLGLVAGANTVYAETGANPRDTEEDTSRNRGLDMAACRKMLYEAGFTGVVRGDGEVIPLDFEYVRDALQRKADVSPCRTERP